MRDQKRTSTKILSKIWRIDRDTAERNLDVTYKKFRRSDTPSLSRNYPTNDRILRYKKLMNYFIWTNSFPQIIPGSHKL